MVIFMVFQKENILSLSESLMMSKPYKEQESRERNVGESIIAYTNSKGESFAAGMRDDVRCAISGKNCWIGFALA